jgi:hypothetical protein
MSIGVVPPFRTSPPPRQGTPCPALGPQHPRAPQHNCAPARMTRVSRGGLVDAARLPHSSTSGRRGSICGTIATTPAIPVPTCLEHRDLEMLAPHRPLRRAAQGMLMTRTCPDRPAGAAQGHAHGTRTTSCAMPRPTVASDAPHRSVRRAPIRVRTRLNSRCYCAPDYT